MSTRKSRNQRYFDKIKMEEEEKKKLEALRPSIDVDDIANVMELTDGFSGSSDSSSSDG
jgi:hypothetical protein